jgi:5-oxoprolinase (ATP-hydrolysing)
MQALFGERYQAVFGHRPEGRSVELVSLRAVASTPPATAPPPAEHAADYRPDPVSRTRTCFGGRWYETDVYDWERLDPGASVRGPALIYERYSAAVIEPEWQIRVDHARTLVARAPERRSSESRAHRPQQSEQPEALRRELFTHRFETIAREMGESLRRTAVSTNVKERLDFSCALLDATGELIVNAPHIPVHLGSLGLCVRAVKAALSLRPGDTVITNHPAYGGSHLPDVTLVSPVHDASGRLLAYVASRAHHGELGGMLPGSMPPSATCLAEEGIVIAPRYLVAERQPQWDEVTRLLTQGPYPTRALSDNLADLRAALAANQRGVLALRHLASIHGADALGHYMNVLKDHAEEVLRRALRQIPDGTYRAQEQLDDGTPLQVGRLCKWPSGSREMKRSSTGRALPMSMRATSTPRRLSFAAPYSTCSASCSTNRCRSTRA